MERITLRTMHKSVIPIAKVYSLISAAPVMKSIAFIKQAGENSLTFGNKVTRQAMKKTAPVHRRAAPFQQKNTEAGIMTVISHKPNKQKQKAVNTKCLTIPLSQKYSL